MISNKKVVQARLIDLMACLLNLIDTSNDEGEREWLETKVEEVENKIKELDK